jgi:hypothetical protein
VPDYFGISIATLDMSQYRVAGELREGSTVGGAGKALSKWLALGSRVDSARSSVNANQLAILYHCRARPDIAQLIRRDGDFKLLPMHEVFAYCMSPMLVPILGARGIVLKEEVVLALEVTQPVRIVQPPGPGGEVELRPQGLVIRGLLQHGEHWK